MATRVATVSQGRGWSRLRVEGLLGNEALAAWLESAAADRGWSASASAQSGTLRVRTGTAEAGDLWVGRIGHLVSRYEPTRRPLHAAASARVAPVHGRRANARRTESDARARAMPAGRTRGTQAVAGERQASALARSRGALDEHDAHALPIADLLRRLDASERGLTSGDATSRLARDGPNEIGDVAGRGDWQILVDQFRSIPSALLAGSAGVSLATRARVDALAIAAVLLANAVIGFRSERQAEQTVASLRRLSPQAARVLRDGRVVEVPAREVVVGDVLVLEPGVSVAADARVLAAHRLAVNEAPLTGESLPVRKQAQDALPRTTALAERSNLVHMGTVVSGGTGRAVVVACAGRTVLGRIRSLAQEAAPPVTRMHAELDRLGSRLAIGASLLCVLVFGVGALRGRALAPLVRTTVSLAVAAIPEGLPAVATTLLARAVRRLQASQIFPRSLQAVENLGAIDVVCFDKTGTLTQNRMAVSARVDGVRRVDGPAGAAPPSPEWLMVATLCNDARTGDGHESGSATERALLAYAADAGADVDGLRQRYPRVDVRQRSEHHPYMVTIHREASQAQFVAVKGRPAEVLARCVTWHQEGRAIPLDDDARHALACANDALAAEGYRVLALAYQRTGSALVGETGNLVWLGLVALADPLRNGIAEMVDRFSAAGIRCVMITGDQPGTARAVAAAIGLDRVGEVVDAAGLPERADELLEVVERGAVFARTSPAMKLEIVKALQRRGHVVAMTGDGVNDGPALKTADVGVAMGVSGTDFAHAMSDLVLQSDHPAALLEAIAEGRTVFANVGKSIDYLVSTNLSELATTAIAVVSGLPDPLDPIALLWMNLVTDVWPALAIGEEPADEALMSGPPISRVAMQGPGHWRGLGRDATAMTVAALASFVASLATGGDLRRARTGAFTTLTVAQLLHAASARSALPVGDPARPGNPALTRALAVSVPLQLATLAPGPLRTILRTRPPTAAGLAFVTVAALAPVALREMGKHLARRGSVR